MSERIPGRVRLLAALLVLAWSLFVRRLMLDVISWTHKPLPFLGSGGVGTAVFVFYGGLPASLLALRSRAAAPVLVGWGLLLVGAAVPAGIVTARAASQWGFGHGWFEVAHAAALALTGVIVCVAARRVARELPPLVLPEVPGSQPRYPQRARRFLHGLAAVFMMAVYVFFQYLMGLERG